MSDQSPEHSADCNASAAQDNTGNATPSPWNWRPEGPVQNNPLFSWPPSPTAILRWYASAWKPLSEQAFFVFLMLVTWFYLQPPLAQTQTLESGWVAAIYARNLTFMLVIAGGLHLYFFSYQCQGTERRYDRRSLGSGSRFTLGTQVRDNMFWSLASGVTLWTAYETFMIWAQSNEIAPVAYWNDGPVWFLLLIFLIPLWISLHFYWVHRFLHWPPLYRIAHALHHRNVSTGPWSGISMHPIEHFIYFSSLLIHLVVPSHPMHLFFHMYALTLSAVFGHTGFDSLLIKGRNIMPIGHFHHQLHHRYFECNYGAAEMPWDAWFGTFDDGSPEARSRLVQKMRGRFEANSKVN